MTLKLKQIMLLSALSMVQGATATVRYASPTGNSAEGTSIEKPGRLTSMLEKLEAGDELYLLDGQYDFSSTISINKSGTADNYITIAAYEGATPILDFRLQPNGNGNNAVKMGGSYIHLRGITIRYAGYKGIWVEKGKYNVLERLDVYGCCNAGIQLRSGGYNTVVNCDAHDNFDYQDQGGNADGFADKQGTACPGNVYIGCRSWNNSDDGWDSYQRETNGTPTVYINCITYNNGPATYNLTNHPRVTGIDADLNCFRGKDLANFANGGNPNGFKLGGKGTVHDAELYRCLAIGHRQKGFDQNNNAGTMKLVNCTAYRNQTNYGFGNSYAYTLDLYNCISLSPTGGSGKSSHLATAAKGTVTQSNNSWNDGFSVSEDDFESLDVEGLLLGDRQADGSLPESLLLHLKTTATNLIDQGTVIPADYFEGDEIGTFVSFEGAAPDLGCYETNISTGVTQPLSAAKTSAAPCFDLNGRRVGSSYKGVIVQQGRLRFQK